ncbi:MAG: ATP synthase F1 subunit delta [Bacteroidia bacterium]|jgi:F-type H+-transporting ATPase subunit delta
MIVAERYAKALLQLGLERNALKALDADVSILQDTFTASRDLQLFIQSPVISSQKKQNVFTALFKEQLSALGLQFVLLVTRQRRESFLPQIIQAFSSLHLKHQGIERVEVLTAAALDDAARLNLQKVIHATWGNATLMKERIQPDIIGGFIIRQGDRQWDRSIARELKSIRKQLMTKN